MGAYAPALQWIPEDDFLLKNAIEAGASLESLAKGAVQFSRRFTVPQLRERWQSILYDAYASTEASDLMLELIPLKVSKNGNVKECILPEKRKSETVRSSYYAMRKRLFKEPFINSMDLSFLDSQDENNCHGNGNPISFPPSFTDGSISNHVGFGQNNLETTDDPISNRVGFGQTNLETTQNSFPQNVIGDPVAYGFGNNFLDEHNGIEKPQTCQMYEAGGLDPINDDAGNLCLGFGGTQAFASPISDGGGSFHNLGYSSPFSEPIWKTMEGISAPVLSIDDISRVAENEHCRRDEYALPGDNNPTTSGFKCPSTEGYLAELSNSLLNFSNDDDFLYGDGKGIIDKSYYDGLSSLLLNSPIDINNDHVPDVPECEILSNSFLTIAHGVYPQQGNNDNMGPDHVDGHTIYQSEIQSTLPVNSDIPEMQNGVICCVVNTEDTEIPDNDEVFRAMKSLSSVSTASQKTNRSFPSTNDFFENKIHGERVQNMKANEGKVLGQFNGPSKVMTGKQYSSGGCGLPRGRKGTFGVSNQVNTENDMDAPTSNGSHRALHGELGSMDALMEEVVPNPSTSDQDDLSFDDDSCLPCFSDIEAMVLDMTLGSDEKDARFNDVLKYRNDEVKRKIMRLEQSDHACMQRELKSHRAFAVLYGRHSKHYIRKHEVLLGRGTDEVLVDIDLGREGCANRISRRQAIISMDDFGNFHLKNLGKYSIYVNDKEIASKQSHTLNPSCLIEIRDMALIFEMNELFVKMYTDRISDTQ